ASACCDWTACATAVITYLRPGLVPFWGPGRTVPLRRDAPSKCGLPSVPGPPRRSETSPSSLCAFIPEALDGHGDGQRPLAPRLLRDAGGLLLGSGRGVRRRQVRTDVDHRPGRKAKGLALDLEVVGIGDVKRGDEEIAGDANAGVARVDGAARREQVDVGH